MIKSAFQVRDKRILAQSVFIYLLGLFFKYLFWIQFWISFIKIIKHDCHLVKIHLRTYHCDTSNTMSKKEIESNREI